MNVHNEKWSRIEDMSMTESQSTILGYLLTMKVIGDSLRIVNDLDILPVVKERSIIFLKTFEKILLTVPTERMDKDVSYYPPLVVNSTYDEVEISWSIGYKTIGFRLNKDRISWFYVYGTADEMKTGTGIIRNESYIQKLTELINLLISD